jgi:hypothetical protein
MVEKNHLYESCHEFAVIFSLLFLTILPSTYLFPKSDDRYRLFCHHFEGESLPTAVSEYMRQLVS